MTPRMFFDRLDHVSFACLLQLRKTSRLCSQNLQK